MYLTFDKNDQATLKAALDERGLRFPLKHAGREIKGFTVKRRIRLQSLLKKTEEVNCR